MAVNEYNKFVKKLTKRELEVIEAVLSGAFRYKSIASSLNISVNMVKTHLRKIYLTVGVNNIEALASLFYGYSSCKTDITPKSPQIGDMRQPIFAVILYSIIHSGGKKMQILKALRTRTSAIFSLFWVIALVISFTVIRLVSGNRQTDIDFGVNGNKVEETWSNVTNFNELEGTWKILSNVVFPEREDSAGTFYLELKDYILNFNTIDNILISSSNRTEVYTGGNVDIWEMWKQMWKEQWEDIDQNEYMLIINELNHSMSIIANNLTQTLSDEVIIDLMSYTQINQDRTKLKEIGDGVEIILHNTTALEKFHFA